jgi:hypothetical protein
VLRVEFVNAGVVVSCLEKRISPRGLCSIPQRLMIWMLLQRECVVPVVSRLSVLATT